ncbi:MAG: hypothetical protein K9K38_21740 [Rhodoferax sp.]|nr:hypothetical protein [Rhodoferax sp.]
MHSSKASRGVATLLIAAMAWGLTGCGGGSGNGASVSAPTNNPTSDSAQTCSLTEQKTWLRNYMADEYLWYSSLGTPDATATSIETYFKSLLYAEVDRYSYVESTAQFDQFYTEGNYVGYGYTLAWADAAQTVLKVRWVEPQSPLGLAGLQRGETIVSIDGYSPAQVVAGTPARVSSPGIPRNFVVRDATNAVRSFTVNSAQYPFVSVPITRILERNIAGRNVKVGYLVYQQFVDGSAAGLASAFSAFAAAGISELVIDLRYNGGGSISVARDLASMVTGTARAGKTFVELRHNALHPEKNSRYLFAASGDPLPAPPLEGLSRVTIITAEGTASASELLINGLAPYHSLLLVGERTFGKPYGFFPVDHCNLTYSVVNFEAVNALGQGGFNTGIAPTCEVPDDLDHALGDPEERRLSAALHYLIQGVCPPAASSRVASTLRLTQANARANAGENAFGEVPRPRLWANRSYR